MLRLTTLTAIALAAAQPAFAAPAVEYGEGDGDNEERLELRARSAAAIGPGTVFRVGRGYSLAGLSTHASGLLRIRRIDSRPPVAHRASLPVIVRVGARESAGRQHVGAGCLRDGRGHRGTSED